MSSGRCRGLPPGPMTALGGALLAAAVMLSAACAMGAASAAPLDPLIEEKSGAVIDWRRGTIEAGGGAAADPRMPSAEAARPGAERRARSAARARLAELLHALPLGGGRHLDDAAVTRALLRAHVTSIDYQSNGGVVIRTLVPFGAWSETPAGEPPAQPGDRSSLGAADAGAASVPPQAAQVALSVSEAHLVAAPLLVVAGQEVSPPRVQYRTAAELPAGIKPVAARADKKGRLVLASEATKTKSDVPGAESSPLRGESASGGETPAALAAKFADTPVVVYVHKVLR